MKRHAKKTAALLSMIILSLLGFSNCSPRRAKVLSKEESQKDSTVRDTVNLGRIKVIQDTSEMSRIRVLYGPPARLKNNKSE